MNNTSGGGRTLQRRPRNVSTAPDVYHLVRLVDAAPASSGAAEADEGGGREVQVRDTSRR